MLKTISYGLLRGWTNFWGRSYIKKNDQFKNNLQKHQQVYDKWINKNSSAVASLRIDRTCIINFINERDDNNNKKGF